MARDVAYYVFGADRIPLPVDHGQGPPVEQGSVSCEDVVEHIHQGAAEARHVNVRRAGVAAEALIKSYYGDILPTDYQDCGYMG